MEFVIGNDGYPPKHEWTQHILDSKFMVMLMTMRYIGYPAWVMEGKLEAGDQYVSDNALGYFVWVWSLYYRGRTDINARDI